MDYLQGGAGKWQNVEVDEGGARRVKSDAAANGRDMTEAGLSKEELDWCALVVTGVTRGEDVKKAFNRSDLSDVAARAEGVKAVTKAGNCHRTVTLETGNGAGAGAAEGPPGHSDAAAGDEEGS